MSQSFSWIANRTSSAGFIDITKFLNGRSWVVQLTYAVAELLPLFSNTELYLQIEIKETNI